MGFAVPALVAGFLGDREFGFAGVDLGLGFQRAAIGDIWWIHVC